jgi:hypothetical protein
MFFAEPEAMFWGKDCACVVGVLAVEGMDGGKAPVTGGWVKGLGVEKLPWGPTSQDDQHPS